MAYYYLSKGELGVNTEPNYNYHRARLENRVSEFPFSFLLLNFPII